MIKSSLTQAKVVSIIASNWSMSVVMTATAKYLTEEVEVMSFFRGGFHRSGGLFRAEQVQALRAAFPDGEALAASVGHLE